MYQLVFKGQCTPGVDVSVARANVAQVFKANQAQLDRMFSGERVIIRNKLDSAAAGKYQAALAKQGIVVHIEPMTPRADAPAPAAKSDAAQSRPESVETGSSEKAPAGAGVAVEPGERLPVAGKRVDQLLAGSRLTLGRPGEVLGQSREAEEPVFTHIDTWSVAPAGEMLAESAPKPAPAVPDVSHLSVLAPGER